MQDHLTRLDGLVLPGAWRLFGTCARAGGEVQGELVAGDLAGGDGPADVQRLLRPTESELLGCLGQGGVEVQGVGEVELALDAGGAVEGDLVVVETHVATIGGLGGVGGCLLGHEPVGGLGDEAFEGGVPDLVGEPGDLGIDEPDGFGGQQQGVLGDPAGAPGWRSPVITRAHTLGRRCLSSTAWAIRVRPASVESPTARASSAMQNSATRGAPGPARSRPVSPPAVIQVAAWWIDSGGCCSAQVAAAASTFASARSASRRDERANDSRSEELSSSSRTPAVVVVMEPIQAPSTDNQTRDSPCMEGDPKPS